MPIRLTAVCHAIVVVLLFVSMPSAAQSVDQADEGLGEVDQANLEHIERLEKMLRDAGIEPPPRPGDDDQPNDDQAAPQDAPDTADAQADPQEDALILSPSFATVVFETESAAINERGGKSAAAVEHIRRWLGRQDVQRRVAAQELIAALTQWAEHELARVESAGDPVDAYIIADDAVNTLGQDPLAKPFKDYLKQLHREHRGLSGLKAMAAYRRAMIGAEAVRLTGDWELIDFQNGSVRQLIREIKTKLALIDNSWPRSEAGQAARQTLKEWSQREAQALADLPAWRYTVQLAYIQTGTKQDSVVITKPDGTVTVEERTRPAYDPNLVDLFGTFHNTSDKAYRYTFLAGVSVGKYPTVPFSKLRKNQLLGFELIQTPVLQPGEVYNWKATVSVGNIRHVNRKGVTMVESFDPNEGR